LGEIPVFYLPWLLWLLAYQGVGVRKDRKGILQRKTVCGNTVHAKTAQINVKIIKKGTEDLFKDVAKKKEEKKAGKAEKAEPETKTAPAAKPQEKPEAKAAKEDKKQESHPKSESKAPADEKVAKQ